VPQEGLQEQGKEADLPYQLPTEGKWLVCLWIFWFQQCGTQHTGR